MILDKDIESIVDKLEQQNNVEGIKAVLKTVIYYQGKMLDSQIGDEKISPVDLPVFEEKTELVIDKPAQQLDDELRKAREEVETT